MGALLPISVLERRCTRPYAYVLVSARLFLHKFIVTLRIVWIPDELLNVEEGLASEPVVGRNQRRPDTTLLTSTIHPESVSTYLIQNGCKDMTDELEMQRCDQHVFIRGGFGAIYRGILNDGRLVAIKCVETLNDQEHGKNLKRTAREIYIWSRCHHQGILPVLGFARFRGQMALITPWMGAGSLKQHVLRGSLSTPLQTVSEELQQIAVQHLHANGIVHGDIKPDNVLMTDHGKAQLADFGSATLTHANALDFTHTTSFNFTLRFAAPEVLREESCVFTKESDIYALGMNIVSGQLPFSDKSALSFINAVINMKLQPSRPNFNNSLRGDVVKDQMWNLLRRCLTYAPEDRPNANEVKNALIEIEELNVKHGGELDSHDWNDPLR
ncbi:kinase-like domain-containing protein [Rhizoctonia solani]|nr:kinase-like domain-containing protein [Rhizoctonia solani]